MIQRMGLLFCVLQHCRLRILYSLTAELFLFPVLPNKIGNHKWYTGTNPCYRACQTD